ncbi:MAG: hypothetical protein BWX84_00103 [Verrucomicrobia bacterium ADurb.Bin118]|nr:MAG: hypothetical protein BWX84_00103 [Verrucomicrobia bacterium ADurb.Bin118]
MEQKQFAPTPIFGAFAVSLVKPAQLDNFFLQLFCRWRGRAGDRSKFYRDVKMRAEPVAARIQAAKSDTHLPTDRSSDSGLHCPWEGRHFSADGADFRELPQSTGERFAAPSATRSRQSSSVTASEVWRRRPRLFASGGECDQLARVITRSNREFGRKEMSDQPPRPVVRKRDNLKMRHARVKPSLPWPLQNTENAEIRCFIKKTGLIRR